MRHRYLRQYTIFRCAILGLPVEPQPGTGVHDSDFEMLRRVLGHSMQRVEERNTTVNKLSEGIRGVTDAKIYPLYVNQGTDFAAIFPLRPSNVQYWINL